MAVQVEFQSLIGDANCVNSVAPPKSLVRTLMKIDNSCIPNTKQL